MCYLNIHKLYISKPEKFINMCIKPIPIFLESLKVISLLVLARRKIRILISLGIEILTVLIKIHEYLIS